MCPGKEAVLKGCLYNCPKEMVPLNHEPFLPLAFQHEVAQRLPSRPATFSPLKYCAYELSVHIFKPAVKKDFFKKIAKFYVFVLELFQASSDTWL